MADQILSQDEVDALLEGVTGESQKLERDDGPAEGIRNYDISSQERIVRGRMPTMEIINERFARNLRIGLFNFMRRTPGDLGRPGARHQVFSVPARHRRADQPQHRLAARRCAARAW